MIRLAWCWHNPTRYLISTPNILSGRVESAGIWQQIWLGSYLFTSLFRYFASFPFVSSARKILVAERCSSKLSLASVGAPHVASSDRDAD